MKRQYQKHEHVCTEAAATTIPGDNQISAGSDVYFDSYMNQYGHLLVFLGKVIQGFIDEDQKVFHCVYFDEQKMDGITYPLDYFHSDLLPRANRAWVGDLLKLYNGKKYITASNKKTPM